MSRFFSQKYSRLTPYTPGEQPASLNGCVKLNTNESPYPPSERALEYARTHTRSLNLYSEITPKALSETLARQLDVSPEEIILGNGSDEILNFAFMAFADEAHPAVFPNISYGFYPVFAQLNRIPYTEIPLRADFTIDPSDYEKTGGTVFIANPNAPTGILLTVEEIERIVAFDPNRVVVIDEAYIDFGGESCVKLTHRYENLLVVQTFSKSRSMAGGRLGFGVGNSKLIADLNTIKFSTNPYNLNSMTIAMGTGILLDQASVDRNCAAIIAERARTTEALRGMGFTVTDSKANFVFAAHPKADGTLLTQKLRERGVLVRHFTKPEICNYLRITIGTAEQMDVLFRELESILEEIK